MSPEIYEYIKELEWRKRIDPDCKSCIENFYPELRNGKKLYQIFAPNHVASVACESGKRNHCTCDYCF